MSKREYFDWTPERIETAKRIYLDEGQAASVVGRLFGISRNAVIGKIHRLGLAQSRRPDLAIINNVLARTGRMPKPPRVKVARVSKSKVGRKSTKGLQPRISALTGLPVGPSQGPRQIPMPGPLPGSTPKHWMQRRAFECSWPVEGEGADVLSCCLPIHAGSWCLAHHAAGRTGAPKVSNFNPDGPRRRAA